MPLYTETIYTFECDSCKYTLRTNIGKILPLEWGVTMVGSNVNFPDFKWKEYMCPTCYKMYLNAKENLRTQLNN
jgi:hypothetical protein